MRENQEKRAPVDEEFAVFLPIQTAGVMGDGRTYENVIALRSVDSADAMTAYWSRLPLESFWATCRVGLLTKLKV